MRVIFAGTPEFARVALAQLHDAGFEILLVLTQPDRPAGRGMKLQASPVKQWAEAHHVPVSQPRSLRLDGKHAEDAAAAQTAIKAALDGGATAMVVAAYGLILPQWVLDAPQLGCLNIHASLLPRWRGAAPIHRAVQAGDAETGVTIMQMDAGLDTGDMLLTGRMAIGPQDTTATLHDRLANLGGELIVQAMHLAEQGRLMPVPQPADGITYASKIEKSEAVLDWCADATSLERCIRAFTPFPGASALIHGEAIKLWQATVLPASSPRDTVPGQVLAAGADGVDIGTGGGVLRVHRLQRAGGRPLEAAEFLRGFGIKPGDVFQSAAHGANEQQKAKK